MSGEIPRAGLEPLRRLLESARDGGGEAKVDALIALTQRTLFVATWEPESPGFRTLENARKETALPVFTGLDLLPAAKLRFGWPEHTAIREIGARQAFRYVIDHALTFLVVDVGTPHAFEATPAELKPLLAPPPTQAASDPFAMLGRTSSQLLEVVRASDVPPGSRPSVIPPRDPPVPRSTRPPAPLSTLPPAPLSSQPQPAPTRPPTPVARPTVPPAVAEGDVVLEVLDEPPDDALLEALSDALAGYLEVEWAAYCRAARGPFPAQRAVALRLDPYRERLPEIIDSLRSHAMRQGVVLDVILADTPHLVRLVRERGVLFHPWKR